MRRCSNCIVSVVWSWVHFGKLANPNSRPNNTYGKGRPTQGQGYSKNGYNPKPGERTIEGYVKNNVSPNAELKLKTNSAGFNSHNGESGGVFKMFGSNSHGGVKPHVHQPYRNVSPTGDIYGGPASGKVGSGLIDFPNTIDIKHLYQYLENGKYR